MSSTPTIELGPVPLLRAALAAVLPPGSGARAQGADATRAFLQDLGALARQEAGLGLRMAMVLACVKQLDVSELGYSGFLAFCREQVDWGQAWVRALVRLVESPLDQVKAAAAAGLIPLRVAVTAPGLVEAEQQTAWLGGRLFEHEPTRPTRTTFHDTDAKVIAQARELARVCMGCTDAPVAMVDAFILRHWREQQPGKALLEGRTAPPPPEPRTLDFTWAVATTVGGTVPAEALLGPWSAPTTLGQALAQLTAIQAVRRGRVTALAHAFAMVHHHALWADDFDSLWEFARQVLGWSRRTAQRYRKLGWALEWNPQLEQAVHDGLSGEAASRIGWLCDTDWQCSRWLRLARHLGQQELLRALQPSGHTLGDYERALAIARQCAAALLAPDGPTTKPSGVSDVFRVGHPDAIEGTAPSASTGAEGARSHSEDTERRANTSAPDATAAPRAAPQEDGTLALRIALPFQREPRRCRLRADPQLALAARWFLANNQPRKLAGFAGAKERARYQCQNPECGRPTLRAATHHVHWRRHGGADTDENATVLCPPCHLRGVHTSSERLRVSRVVVLDHEALLWEFPGRLPVLQFRQVPRMR